MKNRSPIAALTLALAILCLPLCGLSVENRTDWMHEARWGVFVHYLGETGMSSAEWNRLIDNFDVEGLADQLQSIKAGYFVITIGQNSGHYLAPNHTYDSYVGIQPSKCSKRDLVLDLASALERRHILLMVYLPAGAPDEDKVAMQKLSWTRGPDRNAAFQNMWQNVIAEWSLRWGTKIKGWWFDGCYWPNAMYRFCEAPNFHTFAEAARKGNPQSAVAFNPGVVVPIISMSEQEDYTAGETNEPERVSCEQRYVDGKQFQMLSFLGAAWSHGESRFTDAQVAKWSTGIVKHHGVVTWDVPTSRAPQIPEPFLRQLKAIGEAVNQIPR